MSAHLTDGRLGTQPDRLLVDHVNAVELSDELADVESYVLIDLAHAVMLTRQEVFSPEQGRSLVAALLALLDGDPHRMLGADPGIGTITLHLERYLESRCGSAGLDIQRARSRIDQNATGLRLADRRGCVTVMEHLARLGQTLLDAAATHDDVLAPGYTHLQHAQPTTLGHWFNAHYWTTSRNLGRLFDLFGRLNECPLGGAAHSGTAWPIDREVTPPPSAVSHSETAPASGAMESPSTEPWRSTTRRTRRPHVAARFGECEMMPIFVLWLRRSR